MGKKLTQDEFIKKAQLANLKSDGTPKYIYDDKCVYINKRNKVTVLCPIHGYFEINAGAHMRGEGCKECGLEICRNVRRKTKEEVQKDLDEKFNFKYEIIGEYKGNKIDTQFKCRDCGYEFTARSNDVLTGRRVCKKCYLNRNKSNLEEIIDNLLKNNNIEYIFQCSNKNLNFLGRKTLDFYIPKYKIAIECQGIQHFKPIEHFGGEKRLKRTIELDKEKKMICENNGVKILYFSNLNIDYPYDVIEDENIIINYILSK